MIPNTDINCGKCAAPIYSDCVMWSGQNLACVTLLQDCCDTSLTKVIELLGGYVCNLSNVANYSIPVCMDSYNITDFIGMQNAMMDLLCEQQASIDLSGLTWGCITSGATSSVEDSMQAVIDEVNNQHISYNTDTDFDIVGEGCNQVLNLKQSQWINITSGVTFYSGYSAIAGTTIEYFIDSLNNIHLRGSITRTGGINLSGTPTGSDQSSLGWVVNGISYSGDQSSAGVGITILDLPSTLMPLSGYYPTLTAQGINRGNDYARGSSVTQYYSFPWVFSLSNVTSTATPLPHKGNQTSALRIGAYVPYGASLLGTTTAGQFNSIYFYIIFSKN